MKCPECYRPLEVANCKGVLIHECSCCKGKWFERDGLKKVKDRADDALRWLDFDPFSDDLPDLPETGESLVCPHCERELQTRRYDTSRVIIHKCSSCRGVWLCAGELVRIIRYLEDLTSGQEAGALARTTFRKFIEALKISRNTGEELKDLWAVIYLLEVRIGTDHPHLANLTRQLYTFAPYI